METSWFLYFYVMDPRGHGGLWSKVVWDVNEGFKDNTKRYTGDNT